MGRPRSEKAGSDATSKVDSKSKVIRTSTRERKEILHNYNEDSHSESEQEEREEEKVSDFESMSESISEGDSSGSEYGVKKSKKGAKGKVSPKKGGRGAVGRKGKGASPKGKSKGGAAKSKAGRKPGRKQKTPSTPVTKTRPSRGQPNKRMKYRERSDSEEESEPDFSDESEPEEPIESESDVEEDIPKSDSASDGESKSRKRKAPGQSKGSRGRPAKGSPSASKNNVKAAAAKNGSEKKKDGKSKLSDESDEFDEEDEERATKKEKKTVSDANGESSEDGDIGESKDNGEKEKPAPTATKSDIKSKPAPVSSADSDDDEDDDVEMKEEVDAGSKSSSKAEESERTLKNTTDTDYKSLNFECDKKTKKGEAWNFKISCWNVGGIKSWVKKNGLEFLKNENPDVLCLQEVKSSEKTQPPEVKTIENYPHIYWSFADAAGHHGVGLLSKTKPLNVQIGFPVKDDDSDEDKKFKNMFNKEGRLIVAEYGSFHLINAYVPNGGRGGAKPDTGKPYPPRVINGERGEWDRLFRTYLKELDAKKPIVVTGDLNVAHEEIDLANPKTNTSTAGFTKEEREGFDTLLKEAGLIDSFRLLYPQEKGAYTFWSYMNNARSKNVGWRLDYYLVSEKLKENVAENTMRSQVFGSDHCPITLMIRVET